jgi:hypothetical protein
MTIEEKIQAIRQMCIEANPEILTKHLNCQNCFRLHGFCRCVVSAFITDRPIRLADVLLAMSDPRLIITSHKGEFRFEGQESAYWNLREDDLTKQSPDTLDFLFTLLRPAGETTGQTT